MCLVDAVSFAAVVTSLLRLDLDLLQPSPPQVRAKGQLREGFRYVRHTPELAVPLAMMAVIGCLAYEFQVVLPQVAKSAFSGNAQAYGFMTATMGLGAVIGGLWTAARGTTGLSALNRAALLFGAAIMLAAIAPTLWTELIALALVGAGSVSFLAQRRHPFVTGAHRDC